MSGLKSVVKTLLCIILLVGVVIIGAENFTTVSAEVKPTASVTKKTLYVKGSPYTIKVNNALAKAVITYSSSNKAVATVSKSGVVTPVKTGSTTVTVKVVQNGSTYNSCIDINVKEMNIINYIEHGNKKVTTCYNNEEYMYAFIIPDLNKYSYSYKLDKDDVIKVTDNWEEAGYLKILFKTLKQGKVSITVKERTTGITYKKVINIVNSDEEIKYNGEIVYFGSYPQSEVDEENLTDDIINADYNNNEAEVDGVKYLRLTYKDVYFEMNNSYQWDWDIEKNEVPYHYFKYEPISWRVLSDSKGDLMLLSDRILFCENYNNSNELVTWEKANIREELNSSFFEMAFNDIEQDNILITSVKNEDTKLVFRYDSKKSKVVEETSNGIGGKGGEATKDKVFLLSLEDALNPKYWIGIKENLSILQRANPLPDRMAYCSTYALFSGCIINSKTLSSQWMLRSPAENNYFVSGLTNNGAVSSYGANVWTAYLGIRPAIRIKRSSLNN
ncbi:DUF6273 domain-containing protein [Anaerocolumna cellulosilytica]|uniref:DUF6273 domain-containing protein n=1 Tax=Anaerocolumna cellulosilytica TaxID=433286 RepID=UPI0016142397|nr:DUF6273 domain-containing protein [Anaerocolumna cellulosilytica]MBB5197698.1 co-chaperonin GroES (HSP10) [Anaerocolumna cellulosilytica]